MQDRQHQPNPEKKANPEKMAGSDEAQRANNESGEKPKNTPTGNERDNKPNTEGSQAGMGE